MKKSMDLKKILPVLSISLDFARTGLNEHHRRVTYIALEIGKRMGLGKEQMVRLFNAAIMHDIGVLTMHEKVALGELEIKKPFDHCVTGADLLDTVPLLRPVSSIIRTHHDRWRGDNPSGLKGRSIPLESRILHVADRLDVLIDHNRYILAQCDGIMAELGGLSNKVLDPEVYELTRSLGQRESFWLDLSTGFLPDLIERQLREIDMTASQTNLRDIAGMFAMVIDGKSKFTHRHSILVSAAAVILASLVGFSDADLEKMAIAGLIHDLGKMSIPEEILEKKGPLRPEEYRIIKRHAYYTYHILDKIDGLEDVKVWAAYHHEKPDGSGYPFHVGGRDLPQGARIMAVCDIFAALTEDRPYRRGMPEHDVRDVLVGLKKRGSVDGDLVDILLGHYPHFEALKRVKHPLEMI